MNTQEVIELLNLQEIQAKQEIIKKYQVDKATVIRVHGNDKYDLSNGMVNIQPLDTSKKFSVGDSVFLQIPVGDKQQTKIISRSNIKIPDEELYEYGDTPVCFLSGTLVKTTTGEMEIEKLKEGDYVLAYDVKLNKIINCRVKKMIIHDKPLEKIREYYLLKTKRSVVRVTKNHRFYAGKDEYKQIQFIDEYVYIFSNNGIEKEKIISKELIATLPVETYNLALNKPNNYFAAGYLVHNVKG